LVLIDSAPEGVKRDKSTPPAPALKRKVNRVLLSSDDEDMKEPTPPPKKKQVTTSTSTAPHAQAAKPRPTQTSPPKKKSKRKKEESDYDDEESPADDTEKDGDSDFMDVDEVEEVKKAPTKVKAGAKRANVVASSSTTRAERKSKATPAKVESEDQEGSKPVPRSKCANFWCSRDWRRVNGPS